MNKLDKIVSTSTAIEKVEDNKKDESEKKKNWFSFFTFWKKSEDTENREEKERKPLSFYINKKSTVLAACVVVIAVASVVNIRYSRSDTDLHEGAPMDDIEVLTADEGEGVENAEASESADYFALAIINRDRVRDEAKDMLESVTMSDTTDVSAKNEAYEKLSIMAKEIEGEANIESLVCAKGFAECVAVISGDSANIIVSCDELTVKDVSQIKEIVYLECGIVPDNIRIIEKASV